MKRALMRFWLCTSGLVFAIGCFAMPPQARKARSLPLNKRNELTLAGILPGVTSIKRARVIISATPKSAPLFKQIEGKDQTESWGSCSDRELTLETDKKGVVQSVRIQSQDSSPECFEPTGAKIRWTTGRGLELGAETGKVVELYGEPTSRSPSTKNGQPLELLYYAFDWAGPDVPQVMEVVCTVPKDGTAGKVVEITLAAGSL